MCMCMKREVYINFLSHFCYYTNKFDDMNFIILYLFVCEQLYEEFADRFDLSECKLAIVHCAGLYDGALIENLWQNIIDKGMTVIEIH